MLAYRDDRWRRGGMTLVELLVVLGIVVLLASMAIPAMRPAAENRRIREGARAVNVYFGSTRGRAMATGRQVGVELTRIGQQPEACAVLRQVEIPPAYGGDIEGAGVRVVAVNVMRLAALVDMAAGDFSPGLIRPGARMQLNYQGPWYTIVDCGFKLDGNGYIDFTSLKANSAPLLVLARDFMSSAKHSYRLWNADGGVANNLTTWAWSDPVPFQILRQPVPTSKPPLRLPRGIVVDLAASGPSGHSFLLVDPAAPPDPAYNPLPLSVPLAGGDLRQGPVIVMFSPTGSVDRVIHYELQYDGAGAVVGGLVEQHRVTEPLHFLVGRWDRMPIQPGGSAVADDGLRNWEDAANLWVTISPQTGLVHVAELYGDALDPATNTYRPSSLFASRKYAREAQIAKGGR